MPEYTDEEVTRWQTEITTLRDELAGLREQMSATPGQDPEIAALREQLSASQTALSEAEARLQERLEALRIELTPKPPLPKSEGDGNPTPVTPKETSSDPKEHKQTKASRLGWV